MLGNADTMTAEQVEACIAHLRSKCDHAAALGDSDTRNILSNGIGKLSGKLAEKNRNFQLSSPEVGTVTGYPPGTPETGAVKPLEAPLVDQVIEAAARLELDDLRKVYVAVARMLFALGDMDYVQQLHAKAGEMLAEVDALAAEATQPEPEPQQPDEPAKRKPGRPKKVQE